MDKCCYLTLFADKTMQQLLSGNVDIGFSGPEQVVYIYNQGREDYPVVFGQLTQRDGSFLVGREEEENFDWSSLKGKEIIGGRPGGIPEMALEYVLKQNGLNPENDVKMVTNVDFTATAGAFKSGIGDYVALFEPTATMLEKDGAGLNLTWEVRDGILNHQTSLMPHTLEGKIVRLSDKIAYINSDFDDAIRAQLLCEDDIPLEIRKTLGFDTKSRLNHMIHNIITNSMDKDDIMMSEESAQAMKELRRFMFENLYKNPVAKSEEVKAKAMLKQLYYYYMDHIDELPDKLLVMLDNGEDRGRIVCDYISGMTDQYAITKFHEYFVPVAWEIDGY